MPWILAVHVDFCSKSPEHLPSQDKQLQQEMSRVETGGGLSKERLASQGKGGSCYQGHHWKALQMLCSLQNILVCLKITSNKISPEHEALSRAMRVLGQMSPSLDLDQAAPRVTQHSFPLCSCSEEHPANCHVLGSSVHQAGPRGGAVPLTSS